MARVDPRCGAAHGQAAQRRGAHAGAGGRRRAAGSGVAPMKASSLIGLGIAVLGLFLGPSMEGSSPMAIINPSAMLIVLCGTLGATIIGANFDAIKNIPKMFGKVFSAPTPDLNGLVKEPVGSPEPPRRDGLLALDEQTESIEDPFTRKGLQLVVDGTDPDLVADILEAENSAMKKRH